MLKENNQTLVLVTGGTGFVGIHAIHQLLQKSFWVKTTLRSLDRKTEILAMLKTAGIILPDWFVRLAALFSPKAKAIAPMLGINRNASNEKAKNILGRQPRANEEAILATAESLLKYNL